MVIEKKFITDGINADDDIRVIGSRQSLNMMNCRTKSGFGGRALRVENVPGTLLIFGGLPAGTNLCLGTAVDESRRRIIFFNYNSNGNHGIYAWDAAVTTTYTILLNANVTGGLNFNKSNRINRDAKVVGNLLYWTDNLNEPKCINIESALVTNNPGYVTTAIPYVFPLDYTSTTLIKRPPAYPLTVARVIDNTYFNNYTAYFSFQFFYRYRFYDGQTSALSAFSNLIQYNFKDEKYNAVDITFPFSEKIKPDVKSIEVCVQFGNTGKAFVVKIYDKSVTADATAINNHNAGTTALYFRFYNDRTGTPLSSVEQVNNQDLVPLTIGTMEIARNRYFAANIKKGYNSPAITSLSTTVTDSSTPAPSANATGYSDQNGFNTPTKVGNTHISGAPITTANYKIVDQNYSDGNSSPNWCTWLDTQPIYQDLSNQQTTLIITGNVTLYDYDVKTGVSKDTTISFYYKAVNATGTLFYKKIATYTIKANTRIYPKVNLQVQVPALAKVFLIMNPDLGVQGYNDNQCQFNNMFIYVVNTTNVVYSAPHFKTNGNYGVAVSFFDRYRRKAGAVIQDSAKFTIPKLTYSNTPNNTVSWALSNANALNEIPDWAYSYQVLVTRNERQSFFIQSLAQFMWYAIKDPSTGIITYNTQDTYGPDSFAVAIGIGGLSDIGVGYVFNDGDLVDVWSDSGTSFTLRVIGVNGSWLLAEKQNIGQLGNNSFWRFEVYTPYRQSLLENYYEATPVYDITNPGLSTRAYATLTGTLVGDTYTIIRSDSVNAYYQAESMNPNDKFWSIWDVNIGWLNIRDTIGQKQLTGQFVFSDTFIQGSQVNGLNKFQPLNFKDIGSDSGQIQKLQLVNKIQEQGTVMLIICTSDVISAYLGEVQLVGSSGNSSLATTADVVGTINSLRGNYGTINPESVFTYLGDAFWFDAINAVMVQYSNNGTFPVSSYKMKRFFANYGQDYRNMTRANIEAINGFSHIPTCVSPFHKELMVTLPALIYSSYAPLLPSYSGVPAYASSINNRFDIYDKLGKTMCFDYEANQWNENFEFMPEWYETIGTDVFMFKGGSLYKMEADTTNYNTFFGVQYPIRMVFTVNSNPSLIKDLLNIAIEGTVQPDYTVAYADNPNIQITDLIAGDYKFKEGVYYAAFFKDRLSPNVTGTAEQKLYSGDILKDPALKLMLEFQRYTGLAWVNFVDIGFVPSRGHGAIAG